MLTLYARFTDEELRALQAHCLDYCYHQYNSKTCNLNCYTRRVCKDLTKLAAHCETLINRRKSEHC